MPALLTSMTSFAMLLFQVPIEYEGDKKEDSDGSNNSPNLQAVPGLTTWCKMQNV